MADQKSLDQLQDLEKAWAHYSDLLKQADTALEQANAFVDSYTSAHPENGHKGPKLTEALKDVRELVGKASGIVAQLDGQIAEAKREAEQRELADDPYAG
jgi:ABC-type transporter Mla subunit MlaD